MNMHSFRFATAQQIADIKALSFKVNDILVPLFAKAQISWLILNLNLVYEGRLS